MIRANILFPYIFLAVPGSIDKILHLSRLLEGI